MKKLIIVFVMLMILLVSVSAQIQLGTIGAQSVSTYEGCRNKVFGLVGASNTVEDWQGQPISSSMMMTKIIKEMCPGSQVILRARGGAWPGAQIDLVNAVLQNGNLDYVILNPSANGQQAGSSITPEQYKNAAINLAQIVKDKDSSIGVIMLTNTPAKGTGGGYGTPEAIQKIKTFNADLLNNKLGRPDLINFAVDTYSATEDPPGSDSCGKFCPNDNLHFGAAGRRAVVKAILDTVFGQPSTPARTSASTPSGVAGTVQPGAGCLNSQRCKEIDEVWRQIAQWLLTSRKGKVWSSAHGWIGFDELYNPKTQSPSQIQIPSSTLTRINTQLINGCPQEMANIDSRFCIDKWEASVVDLTTGQLASPDYTPSGSAGSQYNRYVSNPPSQGSPLEMPARGSEQSSSFVPKAVSLQGVLPQSFVNRKSAEEACKNAGKQLCTRDQWVTACMGPSKTAYPYGNEYVKGSCNREAVWPLGALGRNNNQLDDPRLSRVPGFKVVTGSLSACTNGYGVYDMIGNVDEIVADTPSGRPNNALFLGTHAARAPATAGCTAEITAHDWNYYDYSIGFRCCADVGTATTGAPPTTTANNPSSLSATGAATSSNNFPQYSSSVVSSKEIAKSRTKEQKPNFVPSGNPTFTDIRATSYNTAVFSGEWCSPQGCLSSPSNYPGTETCLQNKGGWCCVPEKGFYEQVKCQGGGVYQGKSYRYNTIQPTPEASPSGSPQSAALTATGTLAESSRTIAVNPDKGTNCYIPYGSWVYTKFKSSLGGSYINAPNDGWYLAEDTGGAFYGMCKIDYYGGIGQEILQFNDNKADYSDVWVFPPTS